MYVSFNVWQYGSWFSKNNHKLSKISHLNFFFARVPLENGVRCGAFDAQSRCISWHVYLIFQLFNTGIEFVDQRQRKTPPKELLVSHVLNDPVRKREEEEEQNIIINSLKSSKNQNSEPKRRITNFLCQFEVQGVSIARKNTGSRLIAHKKSD